MQLWRKKRHHHGFVPWFPETAEGENHFVNYVHHGLHRETGEDVPYPYSSWSYTHDESPFVAKERSDQDIHFKVLDALYICPFIDSSRVNVMVHNGVVHLSGSIESEHEKVTVERLIRTIHEVWDVENELVVSARN